MSCIAAGCGKSWGTISGKVNYQGKPLRGGSVTFVPANGMGGGTSRIAEDGSYSVSKVLAGPVKIVVETKTSAPPPKMPGMQQVPKDAPNYQGEDPERKPGRFIPIPERYADPTQTDLTYDVKAGPQEFNIELK